DRHRAGSGKGHSCRHSQTQNEHLTHILLPPESNWLTRDFPLLWWLGGVDLPTTWSLRSLTVYFRRCHIVKDIIGARKFRCASADFPGKSPTYKPQKIMALARW